MAAEIHEHQAGMLELLQVLKNTYDDLSTVEDPIAVVKNHLEKIMACSENERATEIYDVEKIETVLVLLKHIIAIKHPRISTNVLTPGRPRRASATSKERPADAEERKGHALKIAKRTIGALIKQYTTTLEKIKQVEAARNEASNKMVEACAYLDSILPPPLTEDVEAMTIDVEKQAQLVTACLAGDDIQVALLLFEGAKPDHPNLEGMVPLQAALFGLKPIIVQMIITSIGEASLKSEDWSGYSKEWMGRLKNVFLMINSSESSGRDATYRDFVDLFKSSLFLQQQLFSQQGVDEFVESIKRGAQQEQSKPRPKKPDPAFVDKLQQCWVADIVTINNASPDQVFLKSLDGTIHQYSADQVIEEGVHLAQMGCAMPLVEPMIEFLTEQHERAEKRSIQQQMVAGLVAYGAVNVAGDEGAANPTTTPRRGGPT